MLLNEQIEVLACCGEVFYQQQAKQLYAIFYMRHPRNHHRPE